MYTIGSKVKHSIKRIDNILVAQNRALSLLDEKKREELFDKITKATFTTYEKIVLNSSAEYWIVEDTNKDYKDIAKPSARYDSKKYRYSDQEYIDEIYNDLESKPYGNRQNIARQTLKMDDIEGEDTKLQVLASWSNIIAHSLERDCHRFATDFGYINSGMSDEEKDQGLKRYDKNLKKSFAALKDDNEYSYDYTQLCEILSKPDIDLSAEKNPNLTSIVKIMEKNGFSRATSTKELISNFAKCMENYKYTDRFFDLKVGFSKQLLLKIQELEKKDEDVNVDFYYEDDYFTKDNRGNSTMRAVVCNHAERERYMSNNDCIYKTQLWKKNARYDYPEEFIELTERKHLSEDEAMDEIYDNHFKGEKIKHGELSALCVITSSSVFHLPKNIMEEFAKNHNITLERAKSMTEKSVAYSGSTCIDTNFDAASYSSDVKTVPFCKLPRYTQLEEALTHVEKRNIICEKKKNKKQKGE